MAAGARSTLDIFPLPGSGAADSAAQDETYVSPPAGRTDARSSFMMRSGIIYPLLSATGSTVKNDEGPSVRKTRCETVGGNQSAHPAATRDFGQKAPPASPPSTYIIAINMLHHQDHATSRGI